MFTPKSVHWSDSFVYNHRKLETTQVSFQLGNEKTKTVVHPHNEIQLSRKRNKLLMNTSTWMDHRVHHAKWRKSESDSEGYIMYNSIQPEVEWGWEEGLTAKGQHERDLGLMELLYVLICVVVTWLYAFVKARRTVYQKEWILLYANKKQGINPLAY